MNSSKESKWLSGLNEEQKRAVLHTAGPLLILAGAGAGKTTVLVARAGRLMDEEKVPAQRICVLTFTNKAARELKERVALRIGTSAKSLWAGTFHSFGLQFLKKHHQVAELPKNFGVIDTSDSTAIVKELASHINVGGKKDFDAEKLLKLIHKEASFSPIEDQNYMALAELLAPRYHERLQELGVVDFEGLLRKPLEILKQNESIRTELQNHFQYVMVDEFQDTNDLQMQLVKTLSGEHHNLAVVGDDDQSIYGWRGAQVKNILDFPKQYRKQGCQTVRLEQNYRSTPAILNLANAVIGKNKDRHDKVLRPGKTGAEGVKPEVFIYENEDEEIERTISEIKSFQSRGSSLSDMAVLYRANTIGGLFEALLRKNQIPYKITGGTALLDRREVKDVLAYLRVSFAPNEVALRRVLNTPARGIGLSTIQKIEAFAKAQQISFFKALCYWQQVGVPAKTGQAIGQFLEFIKGIPQRLTDETRPASETLKSLMIEVGYKDYIIQSSPKHAVADKRWGWVEILARILDSFFTQGGRSKKTLREFVEALELRDADLESDKEPAVNLMTFHGCKGLEFPVVFLVGLEEDILPHKRLGGDISEERRLFYVGITRAKERLILSRTQQRRKQGRMHPAVPSRFLLEIPKELIQVYERGVRPVTESERKTKLEDLFAQLEQKAREQKF